MRRYCVELDGRQSAWATLAGEKQPDTLSSLLWYWLLHLEQPILGNTELSYIVVYANKPDCCLVRFDQVPLALRFQVFKVREPVEQATRFTVEYLLRFVRRLEPADSEARSSLLLRLAGVLTQQAVDIDGIGLLCTKLYEAPLHVPRLIRLLVRNADERRKRLGQGTLAGLVRFLNHALDLFTN